MSVASVSTQVTTAPSARASIDMSQVEGAPLSTGRTGFDPETVSPPASDEAFRAAVAKVLAPVPEGYDDFTGTPAFQRIG